MIYSRECRKHETSRGILINQTIAVKNSVHQKTALRKLKVKEKIFAMHIINKGLVSKYKNNAYKSVRIKTDNPTEKCKCSRHFTKDTVQMANKLVDTTIQENCMSLTTETERLHSCDPVIVLLTELHIRVHQRQAQEFS